MSKSSLRRMVKKYGIITSIPRHQVENWYDMFARKLVERLCKWESTELRKLALFVWKVLSTYEKNNLLNKLIPKKQFFMYIDEICDENAVMSRSRILRIISEGAFAAVALTLVTCLYTQDVKKCIAYILDEYIAKYEMCRRHEPEEDILLLSIRRGYWDPIRGTDNPAIRRVIGKVESWSVKHSVRRMRRVFPFLRRFPYGYFRQAFIVLPSIVEKEVGCLEESRRLEIAAYIWKRISKFTITYFEDFQFLVKRDFHYRMLAVGLSVEKIREQCCRLLIYEGILAWVAFHMSHGPVYGRPLKWILGRNLHHMVSILTSAYPQPTEDITTTIFGCIQ